MLEESFVEFKVVLLHQIHQISQKYVFYQNKGLAMVSPLFSMLTEPFLQEMEKTT